MMKHPLARALAAIIWPRAAPDALSGFDPSTKHCTMNCGPHIHDPRTTIERKFLCDDCLTKKELQL